MFSKRTLLLVAVLTMPLLVGRASLSFEQQLRPDSRIKNPARDSNGHPLSNRGMGSSHAPSVGSASIEGSGVRQDVAPSQSLRSLSQVSCPGDFDNNGSVDLADFLAFAGAFGTRSGDARFDARGDIDGNGAIDLSDFLAFAGVFGTTCPVQAPPPVSIPDANLRTVIEDSLGKARGADVTAAEMAGLRRLDAPNRRIADLAGLEYATGLTYLDLGAEDVSGRGNVNSNDISDLSPLSGLTNLTSLYLGSNRVGDVSPLSGLNNLQRLYLSDNQLMGNIPSWLGNLTSLTVLTLQRNQLTGSIPATLGNLTKLQRLSLNDNTGLSGPLPGSLAALVDLEYLRLDGTALCAPTDAAFQAWLKGIETRLGVINCEDGGTKKIYWTDAIEGKIQRANLDGSGVEDLVTGLVEPAGLALDPVAGKMYWTDLESTRIRRANLDGSNAQDLVTGLVGLFGLAVDSGAGKMYWTAEDKIHRANLDGTNDEDLVVTTSTDLQPFVLALNPGAGRMYWTATEGGTIRRSNLNGSGVADLVTGLGGPVGLALDPGAGKMYWAAIEGGKIQRANLDGSGVEDLITGLAGLFSLAVDSGAGKIYWNVVEEDNVPKSGNKIRRANLDGSGVEDVVTGLSAPFGLALDSGNRDGPGTGGSPLPVDVDRDALVALYRATNGPGWTNKTHWLSDSPLGDWHGVTSDPGTGAVLRIELIGNGLTGAIPAELGNLASLQELIIQANNMTGGIPPELGGLANLKGLALVHNNLTGAIPPELGALSNLETLILSHNNLKGAIPPELGALAALEFLVLSQNGLTGHIPRELGDLASLEALDVSHNDLGGPIPGELGDVSGLEALFLHDNPKLSGPLPESFTALGKLDVLTATNTRLCLPTDATFQAWWNRTINEAAIRPCVARIAIGSGAGQRQEAGTRLPEPVVVQAIGANGRPAEGALVAFSPEDGHGSADPDLATTGRDGTAYTVWTLGPAVGEQTLIVDASDGPRVRVTATAAATAGELVAASEVVSGSAQRGEAGQPLPKQVIVRTVDAEGSPVVGATVIFSAGEGHGTANPSQVVTDSRGFATTTWTLGLGDIQQTLTATAGAVVIAVRATATYSQRTALEALYHVTGGPEWKNSRNWLEAVPLDDWFGVSADQAGNVVSLELGNNGLTGHIPPAVRALQSLQVLGLALNRLTGQIPAELGSLRRLRHLQLNDNQLVGEIPHELLLLSELETLDLSYNQLVGELPPVHGFDRLKVLAVNGNLLEGGLHHVVWRDLTGLVDLGLSSNRLSGSLPAGLGQLRSLLLLDLSDNRLSGPVPRQFAMLRDILELRLENNPELSGALPASLAESLDRLEVLDIIGTALCAPRDRPFVRWVTSLEKWSGRLCGRGEAWAHLTQAVQGMHGGVPLVAGESALLRVFMTKVLPVAATRPLVRATFFVRGRRVHVASIPASSDAIGTTALQNYLGDSANATIPGRVIQPGLKMVVDIDPNGTLDPALGVPRRFPERGMHSVGVLRAPHIVLTVVPFVYAPTNERLPERLARSLTPSHYLLSDLTYLLPVGDLTIRRANSILTDSRNATKLLRNVWAARLVHGGGRGYWMGLAGWGTTPQGVALGIGGDTFAADVSVATIHPPILAHEFGHNLGLRHAPCGVSDDVDPSFPRSNGSIGYWGYRSPTRYLRERMVPPNTPDLMSYCPSSWISPYHYRRVQYHLSRDLAAASKVPAAPVSSLLVSGGVDIDGAPYLDPAFVVDSRPAVPEAGGSYELQGRRADGSELFSIAFDMPEIMDGDGQSAFVFAIPVQPVWESQLTILALSGPGGAVEMREGSEPPMVIARDSETGELRAVLNNLGDLPAQPVAQKLALEALVPEPGLDVTISRGLPGAADWRR